MAEPTNVPPYVEGHGLLTGKTVLVTAAAGTGIGFSVAQRCVEEGARVVISDKHERRLAESAEQLGVPGIPCDVTDEATVQALFAAATDELGAIDVLVNNAGLGGTAELHEMADEQWLARARRHAQRHLPLLAGRAQPHVRQRPGGDRQQRVGHRVARPGGPGALRGGQGRRDGAHALRGDRGRAARCACERGVAQPGDARQPREGHDRRAARRALGP